jgi:putative transposase
MGDFREMVNDCIRIGLANGASSLKRLSLLSYGTLRGYYLPSYYKLCAISKAAGILASRKKSLRRGYPTRNPCMKKPILTSCYGFKVEDGILKIPLGEKHFEEIPLNGHTLEVLSDAKLRVNSFTLTDRALSLCISKEVEEMKDVASTIGIDRNLGNLAVGNEERVKFYDMSKAVKIVENTRKILSSFKRNDVRIRRVIASKYGGRQSSRVKQILHRISKAVVEEAKQSKSALVFEDIKNIRRLYQRGNGQGQNYRSRMNSWPFAEIKRQIEYKAEWEGVPVIHLTKGETRGTSIRCIRCGERLQGASREDIQHGRELWCEKCGSWLDRDMVAVVNISRRGRLRFDRSEGGSGEAVKGNVEEPPIPGVDAPKLRS